MAHTLLLIRHGQIRANQTGRWHGAIDSPLTPSGRRQVARLARHLKHTFPELEAVYSSPLRRCRDTAIEVAQLFQRTVITDDDLREYAIGELEGTPFRTLHTEHRFFERIHDAEFRPPGGESVRAVAERVVQALRRIHDAHRDARHTAIVGHGAAFAIALAHLLDADPTRWTNYSISNASITELTLDPEPLIPSFNRIEHL